MNTIAVIAGFVVAGLFCILAYCQGRMDGIRWTERCYEDVFVSYDRLLSQFRPLWDNPLWDDWNSPEDALYDKERDA